MSHSRYYTESNVKLSKTKEKMDMHTAPSPTSYSSGNHNVIFNEASKILQIELEKDSTILEQDNIIKNAEKTIDDLRKNIVHLQTEYEQLDCNLRKEITYRDEVLKRIDTTRDMIESAGYYSHILATSIKQVEDDKFKLAEYYNEIRNLQEEVEEKQKKIFIMLEENDDLIKRVSNDVIDKEKSLEEIALLNRNLLQAQYMVKSLQEKRKELESELEKQSHELNEMKSLLFFQKNEKTKYKMIISRLKKKLAQQKTEEMKIRHLRTNILKNKIKMCYFEIRALKEKNYEGEKRILMQLNSIENLENKVKDFEDCLKRVEENKDKEFGEKLKTSLAEREMLRSQLDEAINEKNDAAMRCQQISLDLENLANEYDTTKLHLMEKDNELKKVAEENTSLKQNIKGLTEEISTRNQIINDLEAKLKSEVFQELSEKVVQMSDELQKYYGIEEDLKNEILLLKENMSKQNTDKEQKIHTQCLRITEMEDYITELKAQQRNTEDKLNESTTENNRIKNDLKTKSEELKKIATERLTLENKMKILSGDRELVEALKKDIERLKEEKNELTQSKLKLEEEKEKTVSELQKHIEKGKILMVSQQKKLSETELELAKLKDMRQHSNTNEETVISLKKSMESSQANASVHKVAATKMVAGAGEEKNVDSETIRNLKLGISEIKLTQNSKTFRHSLYTPDMTHEGWLNEGNVDSSPSKVETPSKSRTISSSSSRLYGTPFPSPKFKSISPMAKKRDIYEFDSDSSVERFDPKEVFKAFKTAIKKERTPATRKK